jgi:acetyl esterase/lipase
VSGVLDRRSFLRLIAVAAGAAACTPRLGRRHAGPAWAVERIAYGPAGSNVADLRIPDGPGPHPVVVLLHGGYWQLRFGFEYMNPLAEALTHEGFATWNVEYRRVGEDGGGYPGTFQDVAAATDLLRRLESRRLDLARVTVMGHSAGGQLALWLASAARRRLASSPDPMRIARVVAVAPVTDLRRLGDDGSSPVLKLVGTPESARSARYAEISPIELVPLGVPQVVLHGTADWLLPIAMSQRYVETARARGDDATLVPLAGLGHIEPADPTSSAWPSLLGAARVA